MPQNPLTPEAKRALAEAIARKEVSDKEAQDEKPKENCSRRAEPTRNGDWERKEIADDF